MPQVLWVTGRESNPMTGPDAAKPPLTTFPTSHAIAISFSP